MTKLYEFMPIPRAVAEEAGYVSDCVEIVPDANGIGWALHARTGYRWAIGALRGGQR